MRHTQLISPALTYIRIGPLGAANHVDAGLLAGLVPWVAPLEPAATEFAPEFVLNSIAVVLVDNNDQAPPRQLTVAKALNDI